MFRRFKKMLMAPISQKNRHSKNGPIQAQRLCQDGRTEQEIVVKTNIETIYREKNPKKTSGSQKVFRRCGPGLVKKSELLLAAEFKHEILCGIVSFSLRTLNRE